MMAQLFFSVFETMCAESCHISVMFEKYLFNDETELHAPGLSENFLNYSLEYSKPDWTCKFGHAHVN